jgi:hypothetical protein
LDKHTEIRKETFTNHYKTKAGMEIERGFSLRNENDKILTVKAQALTKKIAEQEAARKLLIVKTQIHNS